MKYYLKYFSHIFLLFYCNIIFHKSVDKIIRHENKAVQCTSRNTGSFSALKRKMWGKNAALVTRVHNNGRKQ